MNRYYLIIIVYITQLSSRYSVPSSFSFLIGVNFSWLRYGWVIATTVFRPSSSACENRIKTSKIVGYGCIHSTIQGSEESWYGQRSVG
jgi:hypothetical protein